MKIRQILPSDLPKVLALERRTFSDPWSFGSFLATLANSQERIFVAAMGSELVGYIGLWRMFDSVHITNLAVKEEYRRQGIGLRLLAEAEKWAGGFPLTLELRANNTAAKALYEKFGFVVCGVRPGYYKDGEDALIMWKELKVDSGN